LDRISLVEYEGGTTETELGQEAEPPGCITADRRNGHKGVMSWLHISGHLVKKMCSEELPSCSTRRDRDGRTRGGSSRSKNWSSVRPTEARRCCFSEFEGTGGPPKRGNPSRRRSDNRQRPSVGREHRVGQHSGWGRVSWPGTRMGFGSRPTSKGGDWPQLRWRSNISAENSEPFKKNLETFVCPARWLRSIRSITRSFYKWLEGCTKRCALDIFWSVAAKNIFKEWQTSAQCMGYEMSFKGRAELSFMLGSMCQQVTDSAMVPPKCPFGYDSETFKLRPFSCIICQVLLFESRKCGPCSHVYGPTCISRFKDCPLCGADIEKIEVNSNLQDMVDRFIGGGLRRRPFLEWRCGGILAETGIVCVNARDRHTILYFELVTGAVILALNIAWQMLRNGKIAKVTCKNHLIQKASSLGILPEARVEREVLKCQRELADSVKEDVKKEDAKNLEAKLQRDMLQCGQGWRILDLMAALGRSRVQHGSSWSPDSALRISWVVLLERAELLFQRKGRDVIAELHFFHSISTLRARCLKGEGNVTSSPTPAHAVMTWRV
jgi:hypothetical protein